MDDDVKRDLSFLSSFDEDEIGSRMTTDFVSIRADMTVRQAMKELIRQAADTDNISTLYAVDANGVLVGAIDLKELIIARETTALDDILMTSYPYVYADELIEDCVERIRAYSEDSIPVLNADNRLSGALTAQVVAELVADELGEDYAKLFRTLNRQGYQGRVSAVAHGEYTAGDAAAALECLRAAWSESLT